MKLPDQRNTRLADAIKAKFGGTGKRKVGYAKFTNALGVNKSLVSLIVGQHKKLPSDQKKVWAEILGKEVHYLWNYERRE